MLRLDVIRLEPGLEPERSVSGEPETVVLRDALAGDSIELPAVTAEMPRAPRELPVREVAADREEPAAGARVARTATLAVDVPAGAASVCVLALDGEGQVIASTDIELEAALPAEVLLELVASGLAAESLESLDLRVRVTPELAAALAAAARARKSPGRAKGKRRASR